MTDLYELLGVARDASREEISAAFRKKAKTAHPDNQDTGDEALMKALSEAYDTLSDPESRAHYDATGTFGKDARAWTEQINNELIALLSASIDACFDAGLESHTRNIINAARKMADMNLQRQNDLLKQEQRKKKVAERLLKRCKGELLLNVIQSRIDGAASEINKAERTIKLIDAIVGRLDEFSHDPETMNEIFARTVNETQQSTTTIKFITNNDWD